MILKVQNAILNYPRFEFREPFGNRVEFLEST